MHVYVWLGDLVRADKISSDRLYSDRGERRARRRWLSKTVRRWMDAPSVEHYHWRVNDRETLRVAMTDRHLLVTMSADVGPPRRPGEPDLDLPTEILRQIEGIKAAQLCVEWPRIPGEP